MKVNWIVFLAICLFGVCIPVQEASIISLQSFVEHVVDIGKFKISGLFHLNDSAIFHMWDFFKTTYGRAYSSIGLFTINNYFLFFNYVFYFRGRTTAS
jgi:hypothetical protein